MSIEERPRGYDEKAGESSSAETDVECKLDILKEETDNEGDSLHLY